MSEVNTYTSFQAWRAECASRGFRGPFKLISRPLNSYQYLGDSGTAALWNGESGLGSIFEEKAAGKSEVEK
jgi:hypothetical protein